jgi:TonB family protein
MEGAPRTRSQSSTHTVSVIVLTSDPALLATLREAAGVGHEFLPAASIGSAVEHLLGGHCGIFVIDVAIVGNELGRLTEKLQSQFPEVVLLATGHRNEQNSIAGLVASGRIYRFLHKPVSPARAELFLSAATRRYSELHHNESRASSAVRLATSRTRNVLIASGIAVAMTASAWLFWPRGGAERLAAATAQTSEPAPIASSELQQTLSRAEAAYTAGNIFPPADGNAFDLYRGSTQIAPDNVQARAGVERIVADAERQLASALAAQNAVRASAALDVLQRISPQHPRLGSSRNQLRALTHRPAAPSPAISPTRRADTPVSPVRATRGSTPAATPNLDLAKAFLAANQLVEPVEASALHQLRQARASGENQSAVQIAATDLGTRLLNRALAAVNAADLGEARRSYEAAASLDREFETSLPDLDVIAGRLKELEGATARASVIGERLARVTKLRTSGQLIQPAGDNAYEALKQILDEHITSPEVRTEQQRLSFALLENVRTALAAGDVDQADVLSTRAEEVQPGLPQTKALRAQIGAARAERDDQTAIIQAASLPRRREMPAIYPREALLSNIEGWVDLEFVISAEGAPTEVKVKAAQPSRVFETAAMQALRQWRFEPIVRNGAPQARRATLRMEFKLQG